MYSLYLLQCKDKTLYTGITTNVERRFKEHKDGTSSKYTKAHGASKILYTEKHKDRSSASKREAEIKNFARGEKLKLILEYKKQQKK